MAFFHLFSCIGTSFGAGKKLLATMLNHVFDRTSIEIEDAFCQGFRVAFLLAAEAFLGD